jgi:hypothetical protein
MLSKHKLRPALYGSALTPALANLTPVTATENAIERDDMSKSMKRTAGGKRSFRPLKKLAMKGR